MNSTNKKLKLYAFRTAVQNLQPIKLTKRASKLHKDLVAMIRSNVMISSNMISKRPEKLLIDMYQSYNQELLEVSRPIYVSECKNLVCRLTPFVRVGRLLLANSETVIFRFEGLNYTLDDIVHLEDSEIPDCFSIYSSDPENQSTAYWLRKLYIALLNIELVYERVEILCRHRLHEFDRKQVKTIIRR